MKPLYLVALALILLVLCAAIASTGALFGNPEPTPVAVSVPGMFGTPISGVDTVPGSDAGPPIFGTPIFTTPMFVTPAYPPQSPQTVPGADAGIPPQLPATGAWGLPFDIQRLIGRALGRGVMPDRPAAQQLPIVGRITIPAINVDAPLVQVQPALRLATDGSRRLFWDVPDYAAGLFGGSALPGQPGNTVISGHNNIGAMVFRALEELRPGDGIFVQLGDGTQVSYTVRQVLIVPEDGEPDSVRLTNARYIGATGDVRLTLISCWPDWSNSERVIVVAMP
jgi:sortase A